MLTREMVPTAASLVNYAGSFEGWGLDHGSLQIVAMDEGPFLDNDEAAEFVRAEAARGSAIHKLAIECAMAPHQPYFLAAVQ